MQPIQNGILLKIFRGLSLHRTGAGRALCPSPRSCLIFTGTEAPVSSLPFSAAASPASGAGLSSLYMIFT